MNNKALRLIIAYLLLLPILLLGLWIFFLGREVVTGLMREYYVGSSPGRAFQAGLYDRVLTLVLGLGWMVLFVVAEELLRRRVTKGNMLKVFFRFMGVECWLALGLDLLMLFFLTGPAVAGWLRWSVVVVELVLGGVFIFWGWSRRSPWYEERKTGILEPPPTASERPTHRSSS